MLSFASELKNHQISPLLRRITTIVFISGITSYIFKTFYYQYELIDFLDYRGAYKFIVDGEFIVPAGIFFIVWFATDFISFISFKLGNLILSTKLRRKIYKFSFFRSYQKERFKSVENALILQGGADRDAWLDLFTLIRNSISSVDLVKLQKNIGRVQSNIEKEFLLLIRGSIATILYFSTIDYFGWKLFLIFFLIAVYISFSLYLAYLLAEIIPVLLYKTFDELEALIDLRQNRML